MCLKVCARLAGVLLCFFSQIVELSFSVSDIFTKISYSVNISSWSQIKFKFIINLKKLKKKRKVSLLFREMILL